MISSYVIIPRLFHRVDYQILWRVALKVWLGYICSPRMEDLRDVKVSVDMIKKIIPDHTVADDWIGAILHPERVEFRTVVVDEVA